MRSNTLASTHSCEDEQDLPGIGHIDHHISTIIGGRLLVRLQDLIFLFSKSYKHIVLQLCDLPIGFAGNRASPVPVWMDNARVPGDPLGRMRTVLVYSSQWFILTKGNIRSCASGGRTIGRYNVDWHPKIPSYWLGPFSERPHDCGKKAE